MVSLSGPRQAQVSARVGHLVNDRARAVAPHRPKGMIEGLTTASARSARGRPAAVARERAALAHDSTLLSK